MNGRVEHPSIVQYWHSGRPPVEVAEMLATFPEHNPALRQRVFSRATAEKLIAAHHSGREVAAFRACAVPAMQADYFRYCAASAIGGLAVDADFRCLRPLSGLFAAAGDALLLHREERGNVVNGFLLFRRPGHPLPRLALNLATANIERRLLPGAVNWVTGPMVLTSLLALRQAGSFEAARKAAKASAGGSMDGYAEHLIAAVGEYARLEEAFDSVRLEPFGFVSRWLLHGGAAIPYKQGDEHWARWHQRRASIFTEVD